MKQKSNKDRRAQAPRASIHQAAPAVEATSQAKSSAQPLPGESSTHADALDKTVLVTSFTVLGAHATWYFVGPAVLVFLLAKIVQTGSGWLTALDVVFFLVLAIMLLARWVDQRSGQGTTGTGEPSTWEQFRRYVLVLPTLALAAWLIANVVGNHLLNSTNSL
jgi:hypothetical protein